MEEDVMLRPITAVVAGVALLGSVAACAGNPASAANNAPSAGANPPAGPNPNAPETNPGGDIPDTTVFVPYRYDAGHYTVAVPQGWGRTTQGAAIVFTDKLNSVRMESVPEAVAPTVNSVRANEIPRIRATAGNVRMGTVRVVRRKAGPAVETSYSADGSPDPVTGKTVRDAVLRYEFFHNGTVAVLTVAGPVGADNVDPWRKVTDSFGWTQ
jgi:hypothetical protein